MPLDGQPVENAPRLPHPDHLAWKTLRVYHITTTSATAACANIKSGHFHFAQNRTFSFCVDTTTFHEEPNREDMLYCCRNLRAGGIQEDKVAWTSLRR